MNEALSIAWRAEFAIYRFGASVNHYGETCTTKLKIDRPGAETMHFHIFVIYDMLKVYKCMYNCKYIVYFPSAWSLSW